MGQAACVVCVCLFFQAEDGIRDGHVTGVQTCALPIYSVQGMGSLVFQMLEAGETDAEICNKLGLEVQELVRLKHITGYSKLFADVEYSEVTLADTQLEEKAKYARENPGEKIPRF